MSKVRKLIKSMVVDEQVIVRPVMKMTLSAGHHILAGGAVPARRQNCPREPESFVVVRVGSTSHHHTRHGCRNFRPGLAWETPYHVPSLVSHRLGPMTRGQP